MSAVVFDCDGVLVDTEPLSAKAWRRVLLEFGYSASDEDLAACVGRTRSDTYRYFAGLHPLPDIAVLSNAVADAIAPLLDAGVEPFPDAVNTVKELALHGVPLAVASSSRRTELDLKLQQTDLRRYFDKRFKAEHERRLVDTRTPPD